MTMNQICDELSEICTLLEFEPPLYSKVLLSNLPFLSKRPVAKKNWDRIALSVLVARNLKFSGLYTSGNKFGNRAKIRSANKMCSSSPSGCKNFSSMFSSCKSDPVLRIQSVRAFKSSVHKSPLPSLWFSVNKIRFWFSVNKTRLVKNKSKVFKYSGDPNYRLGQYYNGPKQSNHWMVRYSDHRLNTGQIFGDDGRITIVW